MSWTVQYDEETIKWLEKQPVDIRERIFRKVKTTKKNPKRYFQRLTGRDDYRLRVGEWRVIADLDAEQQRITVTLIGHRRNIYS